MNRRRLAVIVVALLAFGIVAGLDARLSSLSSLGFVPAEARWTVRSADFPAFLEGLQASAAYQRARAAAAVPTENFWLHTRKTAGIRPTPARFRHWLGHSLAAATTDAGFGICVRPGLLIRSASMLAGTYDRGTVHTYHGYHYAWRDGFLIASESADYVRESLAPDAVEIQSAPPSPAAAIAFHGETSVSMTVEGRESVPCRGRIERSFTRTESGLTLADAWPEAPILAVAGADASEVLALAREWLEGTPMTEHVNLTIDALTAELPENVAREGDEFALGLTDVDMSENLPVPELALLLRGETAGVLPDQPAGALPYEWYGTPGWVRPWLGEKLSVCVAAWERTRYMASRETLMPRLVRQLRDGQRSGGDLIVTLDWTRAGPIARDLALQAADQELLHRRNRDDVERQVVPYIDMLSALGTARLHARSDGDSTVFEGVLAAP